MKDKMSIDMTHGPLMKKILLFSLPLIASNILQILFNTVDTVIVGRFAGYNSLAAVGSTAPIIMLFVNSFVGVSVGVNVVIARYIGLRDHQEEIARSLHTAIAVAGIGGALMGALGIACSASMVDLIGIPAEIRSLALTYLRIYFAGTLFMMVYNFGAAALRATGDTRRPLVFLVISGDINIVLNLFFVIALHMDVAGVALATVISQAVSAAMILVCLMRMRGDIHFCWQQLCIDGARLREMAHIGLPSWMQSLLFSLSNVVIQSAINSYSSVVIAGCSAGASIESLLYLAMNAISQACQTFSSQNLGAGRIDRVRRVVRICVLSVAVLGIAECSLSVLFAGPLVGVYNSDPAVIAAGVYRLRVVATLYWIYGISDVLMGAIRGCGVAVAPMLINLLCTCVLRLLWIGLVDTSKVGVGVVYLSYPGTWLALLIVLAPFWLHLLHKMQRQHEACAVNRG